MSGLSLMLLTFPLIIASTTMPPRLHMQSVQAIITPRALSLHAGLARAHFQGASFASQLLSAPPVSLLDTPRT